MRSDDEKPLLPPPNRGRAPTRGGGESDVGPVCVVGGSCKYVRGGQAPQAEKKKKANGKKKKGAGVPESTKSGESAPVKSQKR